MPSSFVLPPSFPVAAVSDAAGSPASARPSVELRVGDQLLTALVPQGWLGVPTPQGLLFRREGPARRTVESLSLTYGANAEPAGAFPARRSLGERMVRYRLDREEGGSGGDEFDLAAWLPCGTGHLLLRFSTQAESPADPALEVAWALLAGAACRPAA
ncbi:Tsi3 family protein [Roseococcus pinisoli]|uniref:Tsi3 family protein n=1 Tax=Roseococcus pinisoli TaxID=2835040 RepID=A0ABS5QHD6_9PROT|nr:Tsi3 family protein [Roseococcus pinisoli]MBS7813090.1 Tsi3 family protein [Roseococcus pinisoli]